jgi:hypothetical protein
VPARRKSGTAVLQARIATLAASAGDKAEAGIRIAEASRKFPLRRDEYPKWEMWGDAASY